MKMRMIKRLTAALLCVAMFTGIPALAVFDNDAIPAVPAAPEQSSVVELPEAGEPIPSVSEWLEDKAQPISTTVFSVTVPTTVAIHMDANGGITCGDITITNNGTESVIVDDAQMSALNGWTLVDYTSTTFTDANKGQHKVALKLGSLNGTIAAGGGQKTIGVAAKIPYQGVKMTNTAIAQVVFVLRQSEVALQSLSITGDDSVVVGSTIQLTATKVPANTTDTGTISWSSDKSSVATVSNTGLVTGQSFGTAVITASCNGVTATHEVRVTLVPPTIRCDGTTYNTTYHNGVYSVTIYSYASVDPGRTVLVNVSPGNDWTGYSWRLTFSTSSASKTISGSGTLDNWNGGVDVGWDLYSDSVIVTFEAIPLSLEGLDSLVYRSTGNKLTLTGVPSGDESSVTWTSSDATIVSVSGGTLSVEDIGMVTISASYKGFVVTKDITVTWTSPGTYSFTLLLEGPTMANCTGGKYATCSGSGTYIDGTFGGFNGASGTHSITLPIDIPRSAINYFTVGGIRFTWSTGNTWIYEGYLSGGNNIPVTINLVS